MGDDRTAWDDRLDWAVPTCRDRLGRRGPCRGLLGLHDLDQRRAGKIGDDTRQYAKAGSREGARERAACSTRCIHALIHARAALLSLTEQFSQQRLLSLLSTLSWRTNAQLASAYTPLIPFKAQHILTPGPAATFSAGGGPSTLKLTMPSPRRMMRPSVRFCSGSGTGTSSLSAASSAAAAAALRFLPPLRFSLRNSSAARAMSREDGQHVQVSLKRVEWHLLSAMTRFMCMSKASI